MVRTREASSSRTRGALQDMHHVIPGPNDMAVLYLQDQHRSKNIWSEQGGDLVTVHQPHRVYDLDECVRPYVISFGFYEINRIRGINIDHGLYQLCLNDGGVRLTCFIYVLRRWHQHYRTSPMLIGLPIDGAPVTGPSGSFGPNELCLRLLGRVPLRTTYRGGSLKLTWLESQFQTPPNEATEDQLIMFIFYYGRLVKPHQNCVKESMTWVVSLPAIHWICARRGLLEYGEAEHLDAALAKDEIAFRERGQVFRDVGPSMSVPSTSMSWDDGSAPGHARVRLVETPPRPPLGNPRDGKIVRCF
ncbi:hypothetical protein Acr_17g0000050 [Actinidia rufa]|uniref:Uncharacterized protein n=1 Tax=Actinidia rufa TaxID=165716 RepID=A0A7J0G0I9_9ERIC|nr:hypothetical protein Acr_17g0000050 [Actinidia rufa]